MSLKGMEHASESRLVVMSCISSGIIFLSVVLPRFVPNDSGFASATTSAVLFMALFLFAALLGIWTFVSLIKVYSVVSVRARVIGFIPAILLVVTIIWVYLQL
jgi:hypothetical protein